MVGPAMKTFKANKVLTGPLFWSNVLIWSGLVIFSVSSRLFNAVVFFHVYPYQYCRCAA